MVNILDHHKFAKIKLNFNFNENYNSRNFKKHLQFEWIKLN